MKILFLGAATSNHTLRWVNSLSERGHEVLLVCRGDQRAESENIKISSAVQVHYLKYGGGKGYFLNVPEFRNVYKRFKPDVVNAHYATGYGTLARLARTKPLIISFLGSDIYDFPYRSKFNKKLLWGNISYASAIASTSNAMAAKIRQVYPKFKNEIYITPFGVNVNVFKPLQKKEKERPIIGIVKYLEPVYDIPLLIRAFAIVSKQMTIKPMLYIYGGGPLLEELETLCETLGVKEDVKFWGTIPNTEVALAINKMDVFVNCSIRESFGVALVEAMACGVPVVATDTEGFRVVVDDGVTGVILKDRRPETMANEIMKLLLDKKTATSYGKNGRERVLALYDWEKDVSIMEELYSNCASK